MTAMEGAPRTETSGWPADPADGPERHELGVDVRPQGAPKDDAESPRGRLKWLRAAMRLRERDELEAELDLFERASQIRPLTEREMLWVTTLLAVGHYRVVEAA